jgi:hypothetical protein
MVTFTQEMTWRGDKLLFRGRVSDYAVERDSKYPNMWRVRRPDGSLSDMVDRSRAKDAAMGELSRDFTASSAGRVRPRSQVLATRPSAQPPTK